MNQWITAGEKLGFINKLEERTHMGKEHWSAIKTLSKDGDAEVRLRVSQILALFPSIESEYLLLQMRNDEDYLVRTSVCDSLSFSQSQDTLNALIDATVDNHYLVRGYAALSIGDIQCSRDAEGKAATIELLEKIYNKETSEWVKIAIARSLFLLGERSYGTVLLMMVYSRYYRNRCFAIHLLEQLVERNPDFIMAEMQPVLNHRLEIEDARSVKLSLIKLLGVLE